MRRVQAGAVLAAVLVLLWFGYALPAVGWTARRAPTPAEVAGPIADAALVPGAAAWGGRPSPALAERLNGALALWRAGSIRWIVLTGGSDRPGAPSEAAVGARYLEERGVPRSALLLEEGSRDTAGNLAGSRPLLAAAGVRRVAVVSHGFHLYRSLLMARDLGLQAVPVAVPTRWLSVPYYTLREALALMPYWGWVRWRLRGCGPGSILLLDLAVLSLLTLALQVAHALRLLGPRRDWPAGPAPAGVTVILPIKGLDPGAVDHFRHWLAQDPGAPWEVIFSLQDPADPALPVVSALAREVPDRARVLVNPVREGLHGKASNLWHGVRAARYPLLVMADSDIDPPPDLLRRMLPPLGDPRVGLVACLPVAVRARGLWGRLCACGINITLGVQWAPWQDLGLTFGVSGACVALRREVLDAIGGVEAFGPYVAEDARLGILVARAGYRVVLGPPVPLEVGPASRGAVTSLISRGAYMIKRMVSFPHRAAVLAVLLGPYLVLGLGWLRGDGLVAGSGALVLAGRWLLAGVYQVAADPRGWLSGLLPPVVEAIALAVGTRAMMTDAVQWRGLWYRVGPDGRLHRIAGR